MTKGFSRLLATIAFPLTFFAHSLKADSISLTTFDYPGQSQTVLDGISGNDQIVGRYGNSTMNFPAAGFFVANPEGVIASSWSFPSTDEIGGGAYGIGNSGQVAASYFDRTNSTAVYYLRAADGTYTSLAWPAGAGTAAMNNNGNLVYSGGPNLYFPNGGGTYSTVTVPGADPSGNVCVTGYDNAGDTTGYVINPLGETFSFLRDAAGNYTILDVPGSVYTEALGMNDLGQVVGWYVEGSSTGYGFIWSAAIGFTTIDYPGAEYTILDGISDDGTFVGSYDSPGFYEQGLIGTDTAATPEPRSVAIISVGILLLILACRRRRTGNYRIE